MGEVSRSNAVDIYPDVERWLSNVDKIIQRVGRIQDEIKLKKNNCIYRFWLSRKSKNKVVILTRLLSCRIFTIILEFHALWVYKINYGSDYWCTERMMSVMPLASIYGMKRIGKTTTLVKVVVKKAKGLKLFDQVIMGVVSETPNLRQISWSTCGHVRYEISCAVLFQKST